MITRRTVLALLIGTGTVSITAQGEAAAPVIDRYGLGPSGDWVVAWREWQMLPCQLTEMGSWVAVRERDGQLAFANTFGHCQFAHSGLELMPNDLRDQWPCMSLFARARVGEEAYARMKADIKARTLQLLLTLLDTAP